MTPGPGHLPRSWRRARCPRPASASFLGTVGTFDARRVRARRSRRAPPAGLQRPGCGPAARRLSAVARGPGRCAARDARDPYPCCPDTAWQPAPALMPQIPSARWRWRVGKRRRCAGDAPGPRGRSGSRPATVRTPRLWAGVPSTGASALRWRGAWRPGCRRRCTPSPAAGRMASPASAPRGFRSGSRGFRRGFRMCPAGIPRGPARGATRVPPVFRQVFAPFRRCPAASGSCPSTASAPGFGAGPRAHGRAPGGPAAARNCTARRSGGPRRLPVSLGRDEPERCAGAAPALPRSANSGAVLPGYQREPVPIHDLDASLSFTAAAARRQPSALSLSSFDRDHV